MRAMTSMYLGAALASGIASAQVEIEVSEGAREFRVVVSSEHPVSFDVEQLLPPAPGLTPARVGALGRTADGATVGCDRNAEPSFAYTVVSGTNAVKDPVNEVAVSAGAPFRTPWYSSGRLLDLLDRCRGSAPAPAYTMFKIVVELDTTGGPVLKETAWLSLQGRDHPGGRSGEDVTPTSSLRLDAPGRREGHITYEYRSEQRSGGLVILSARDHAEQAVIAHAEVMTRGEARFGQWTDVRFDPAVGVEGVVEVIRRLSDGDVRMNISKPAAREVVRDEAWHALNGLDVPPSGIRPFDAGSAANACLSAFRQRWMPAWVVAADDAYEVGCVLEPGKWASPLVLRVKATGGEWGVTDALSRIYDVIDWKR